MNFLRTLLILGRVSNLPTVWTNVIAGWLVGRQLLDWEVAWLVAGVSFLYWAGMTLNDAFDAHWDSRNAPERPIPSGQISRPTTWLIGALQMIIGTGLLLWKTDARWSFVVALIVAILLYDWLHKKWQGSVLIMGSCRALVYLLAYGAAREQGYFFSISPLIFYIGFGVLVYIAALTFVARSERIEQLSKKQEGQAIVARLSLMVPALFPAITWWCESGRFSLVLVSLVFLVSCAWIVWIRSVLASKQIPRGIAHAIAGIALYDASIAILLEFKAGVICLACFFLTLLLQRFIPAT